MRNTAFLALGVALLIVQSNMYLLLHAIGRLIALIPPHLHFQGATPSLLLPLIVFMGVHEYSIARGAALACVLGYLLDIFAASPVGLFTFISVATFVVSRAAGVRLAAQTLLTKVGLAFVFAVVQGVLIIVLTAIFGGDPARARALALMVLPHAVATAIFAPFIFSIAERVHNATIALPGSGEGAPR